MGLDSVNILGLLQLESYCRESDSFSWTCIYLQLGVFHGKGSGGIVIRDFEHLSNLTDVICSGCVFLFADKTSVVR